MREQNTRLGILLTVLTMITFSAQDALLRYLAADYSVWMVVAFRFWVFAALVIAFAARRRGGLRAVAASPQIGLHVLRGLILIVELILIVTSFVLLGLVKTHAVFAVCPLLVAALSGPLLGERVGWRRWVAIGCGFLGILVILRPGSGTLSLASLVPLAAALLFALFILLTRYVSRRDSGMTSFFWMSVVGAVAVTPAGLWFWQPMGLVDWIWMVVLCGLSGLSHWLMIRTYEVAEASAVQPFTYLQLVFSSVIGVTLFGEGLAWNIVLGAAIIVAAGLFTLWRERLAARR